MWAEDAIQAVYLLLLRGPVVVVGPAALVETVRCFWVLCGHPSWLLSSLVYEAVRHLQWSKLPSAVFACLVTRDASSLCHSP